MLSLFGCSFNKIGETPDKGENMKITSPAFRDGGIIPAEYTCDGDNISPELNFEEVPENAESLALIMDDPDAPSKTFVHWIVWNIPPTENLEKGEPVSYPQGKTGFGKRDYGGPCPPSGTHRYFFKLYALDTTLKLTSGSTKQDLEKVMQNHIIEQAQLVGKYSRQNG